VAEAARPKIYRDGNSASDGASGANVLLLAILEKTSLGLTVRGRPNIWWLTGGKKITEANGAQVAKKCIG
jgi:hypothetical protein